MRYLTKFKSSSVGLATRLIHGQLLVGCFLFSSALAQTDSADETEMDDRAAELDELEIDVEGSIGDAEEQRRWELDGDLRVGYVYAGEDLQDVVFRETDLLRTRWRIRGTLGITSGLRVRARVAGLCSTKDCEPDFILQPNLPNPASIEDGQITIDSMYLQWFRTDRFDIAVGRMETKFVARGGVFSKSLDRNDSNNLRINWTDGLHARYQAANGWQSNFIVQYNDEEGASNIRRDPLDFAASNSRRSYFLAFQNVEPKRRMIQRALDVSYLPASLVVDETGSQLREDYWGVVARVAWRWPVRSDDWRLRLSSELAYASNTQTKQMAGIVGEGSADGLAWNMTASIMDFRPGHSIGVNYARTGAGWLLSPQYADNEELFEIRYMWRPTSRLSVDVRGRWRDELEPLLTPNPARDRFDFYARLTWSFDIANFGHL